MLSALVLNTVQILPASHYTTVTYRRLGLWKTRYNVRRIEELFNFVSKPSSIH